MHIIKFHLYLKAMCKYFKLLYKQRNETRDTGKVAYSVNIRQINVRICSVA